MSERIQSDAVPVEANGDHPVSELARRSRLFREGARKLYEGGCKGGDMWFFELYHHLADVADALDGLERENFALAANQCHAGYGDDYGNHRCREVDAALAAASG